MFFKLGAGDLKFRLYDNVFMLEQYPNNSKRSWGLPPEAFADRSRRLPRQRVGLARRGRISRTVPQRPIPELLDGDHRPLGLGAARQDWIDRHPQVARVPGDPQSVPTRRPVSKPSWRSAARARAAEVGSEASGPMRDRLPSAPEHATRGTPGSTTRPGRVVLCRQGRRAAQCR
jgi:hypothetical protein